MDSDKLTNGRFTSARDRHSRPIPLSVGCEDASPKQKGDEPNWGGQPRYAQCRAVPLLAFPFCSSKAPRYQEDNS